MQMQAIKSSSRPFHMLQSSGHYSWGSASHCFAASPLYSNDRNGPTPEVLVHAPLQFDGLLNFIRAGGSMLYFTFEIFNESKGRSFVATQDHLPAVARALHSNSGPVTAGCIYRLKLCKDSTRRLHAPYTPRYAVRKASTIGVFEGYAYDEKSPGVHVRSTRILT